MPLKRCSIAFALVALSAVQAHATLIASDLFNDPSYSLGANVYPASDQNIGYGYGIGPNDGTGFSSGWSNPYYSPPRTITYGLTYAGLATSRYGAASPAYVPCTYCEYSVSLRAFADNTATTDLWVSFLIQQKGITPQDFSAYPNYGGIGVNDAAGDFLYAGVPGLQPVSTADYSLQAGNGPGQGVADQSAVAAVSGATTLLVVDIRDNGEAYLYVDPTVGQALGAPMATIATGVTPSNATYLNMSDSYGWTYGDIRVGTTYADVTPAGAPAPEPAAWTLMLLGFAGLGGVLRARGKARRAVAQSAA
jgi:hypothetical protein